MSLSVLTTLLRDNPILITGMGAVSAAGESVDALWDAAVAGRSLAAWRKFATEAGGARFAVCSAPELAVDRRDLKPVRKMDRCVQMGWLAAYQAWHQAQLENAYAPERIGLVVGTSRGPIEKLNESFQQLGRRRLLPSLAAHSTLASPSGALAQFFKAKGPGATISATCASAAIAIAWAAEQILLGKADAMLVGGLEAPLQPVVLAQLESAGVLGFNEQAGETCRPFDTRRNGLVLGEGSGFLVLESAATAARRGAVALARLAGWATAVDDSGRSAVHADGAGLLRVMREALAMGALRPDQIEYINAHGTGTKLNDAAEARAVRELLGDRASLVPCTSTKPVTGHCLGATPALEAILCVTALRHQMAPPTANCREPDPDCPITMLPLTARPARMTHVMSNSIGFWGYHASLIFSNLS